MEGNDWIKDAFNKAADLTNLGPDVFGMDAGKMYWRSIDESARVFSAWASLAPRDNKFIALATKDKDFISLLSSMWACGYVAGRSEALEEGDE